MPAAERSDWVSGFAAASTCVLAGPATILWALGTQTQSAQIAFEWLVPAFLGLPIALLGMLGLIYVEIAFRQRRRQILSDQHRE